jgi:hypothetical protein
MKLGQIGAESEPLQGPAVSAEKPKPLSSRWQVK